MRSYNSRRLLLLSSLSLLSGCLVFSPDPIGDIAARYQGAVEYGAITKHNDYLYELEVKGYDYDRMEKGLKRLKFVAAWACAGCRNGNFQGRNFDWLADETVEYVLRTPACVDKDGRRRHATLGVAAPIDVGLGVPAKPDHPEQWGILPFFTMDGVNDAGLVAQVNVVPDMDCGLWDGKNRRCTVQEETDADGNPKKPLSYIIVVRTILDYCSTVEEAIALIQGRNVWGMPGLECHFLVSDAKGSAVIEFVNNKTVVLRGQEVMTNFYVSEWKRVGQHTPHAFGIERYRYLTEGKEKVDSVEKMMEHMKKAWYSQIYFPGNEARFASEMNGDFSAEGFGDMTIFADPARRQACFDWYRTQMFKKGPFSAGAWQTMHCSVYDLVNRTLRICVKENDEPFDFKL